MTSRTDAMDGIKRALAGADEAKRTDEHGRLISPLAPFLADYERRAADWRRVLKANTRRM
jgi:hypothetical protein